jgi:hypothetical protein
MINITKEHGFNIESIHGRNISKQINILNKNKESTVKPIHEDSWDFTETLDV